MRYYGLIDEEEFYKIVDEVVKVLGNGKNHNADKLLLETARAETNLGFTKDLGIKTGGVGLCQFDELPFNDVKQRSLKYRELILDKLKIDISKVEWSELAYNPLLSVLFCRLKYKLIPEEIPTTLEDRAKYWKKYYNSVLGAGTIYHYLTMNS